MKQYDPTEHPLTNEGYIQLLTPDIVTTRGKFNCTRRGVVRLFL